MAKAQKSQGKPYQPDMFDAAEANYQKEKGMKLAKDNRPYSLDVARRIALEIAPDYPEGLTSDDIGLELAKRGYMANPGPAAGSMFKGGGWYFTGERRKSARVTNHSRELKVWRRR